ncbi:MAG: TonB family protein [Mangrovibacterium sp.]
MKHTIMLIIVAFSICSLQAQIGVEEIKLYNKSIKTQEIFYVKSGTNIKNGLYEKKFMGETTVKGEYVDNKRDGRWIFTNEITIEGDYQNDLKNGEWIYKIQKDTISILNYKNGELDGQQVGFFENGNIASKINYLQGVKNGQQEYFYSNGNTKEVSQYTNGNLEGLQIVYSEDGNSINKIYFYKGNPVNFQNIKGNALSSYNESLVNGTGKVQLMTKDEEGNDIILVERNFKDSLLHGIIYGNDYLGNKRFEGQYKSGLMIGKWRYYNDKGKLDHSKTYNYAESLERDTTEFSTMNYNEALIIVENMPEFPGGHDYLREIISRNIKYPKECRLNKIQGRVLVQLAINQVGEMENIKIVKSVDPLLDKEAARVISELPNWVPGFLARIPVKVSFTVPISFILN